MEMENCDQCGALIASEVDYCFACGMCAELQSVKGSLDSLRACIAAADALMSALDVEFGEVGEPADQVDRMRIAYRAARKKVTP